MEIKFDIIKKDSSYLIRSYYNYKGKKIVSDYKPYSDLDGIRMAAFENVRNSVLESNVKDSGHKIHSYPICQMEDGSISGSETIYGSRGFVGRRVDVETRTNYGGPSYSVSLDMNLSHHGSFSFGMPDSENKKEKARAQEILTSLMSELLDISIKPALHKKA